MLLQRGRPYVLQEAPSSCKGGASTEGTSQVASGLVEQAIPGKASAREALCPSKSLQDYPIAISSQIAVHHQPPDIFGVKSLFHQRGCSTSKQV